MIVSPIVRASSEGFVVVVDRSFWWLSRVFCCVVRVERARGDGFDGGKGDTQNKKVTGYDNTDSHVENLLLLMTRLLLSYSPLSSPPPPSTLPASSDE